MTQPARDFLASLRGASRAVREAEILRRCDLWVAWPLCGVSISAHGHDATVRVTSDVFALGTVDEPIRVPLSAQGSQAVADRLGMSLITTAISDAVWRAADARLVPQPWGPPYDASMLSVERLIAHNDRVEARRNGQTGLVAGHKKDVVISNRLAKRPAQVAIYGWHNANGVPIQPLSTVHESTYADYSHGVRLVSLDALADGEPTPLHDLFSSPIYSPLVSHEGALRVTRYPGI